MLKRIIVFLTSLLLIINSTLSSATTIGAWTVSNPFAVGASILYDGLKGAVTSSVLITPNATQVAKVLGTGGAGFALSYAVEQLLGAVDWVLDPANNQIRYRPIPEGENPNIPKFWVINDPFLNPQKVGYSTSEAMCKSVVGKKLWASSPIAATVKLDYSNSTSAGCLAYTDQGALFGSIAISYITNPNYDPNEEKTLPLETVARKVIENAESDNLDAQFAVLAAANNILSEAEQDDAKAKPIEDELENNAKCPSGIISEYGQCWICDKTLHYPMYRATKEAKFATRNKSCKNITDPAIKAANVVLFRNLISARSQENACWLPIHQNHITALNDAKNALILCEN